MYPVEMQSCEKFKESKDRNAELFVWVMQGPHLGIMHAENEVNLSLWVMQGPQRHRISKKTKKFVKGVRPRLGLPKMYQWTHNRTESHCLERLNFRLHNQSSRHHHHQDYLLLLLRLLLPRWCSSGSPRALRAQAEIWPLAQSGDEGVLAVTG